MPLTQDTIIRMLPERTPGVLRSYFWSTVAVLAALVTRLAVEDDAPRALYLLFIPPIFISALVLDKGTAFYSTLLSVLLIHLVLVEPRWRLAWPTPDQALSHGLFVGVGTTIGLVTERLRNLLAEVYRLKRLNDVLLREVHHRIKNDFQQLLSLLILERHRDEPLTVERLAVLEDRIRVMSLVYGQLRSGEGSAAVDSREFVTDLVDNLRNAYLGLRPVALTVAAETYDLPGTAAVPVGLIINELVTNSLKYAFPGNRPGRIDVAFRRDGGAFVLTVADNGVGDAAAAGRAAGIGGLLVQQLAGQLGGEVAVETATGRRTALRFPIPP